MSLKKLALLGDAALKAGDRELALKFYRAILEAAPDAAHVHARVGLALSPHEHGVVYLETQAALERIANKAFVGDGLATWLKTLPFLEDPRFVALAEKHAALLPLPNWHWNLQTAVWAIEQVKGLKGDFVELGVFRGHTTLFCAEYLGFKDWPRTWHLYDTFDGIPDDQVDKGWEQKNVEIYRGSFSFEEVRDRFTHIPNIRVVKGRVPEALHDAPEAIAFLHMDMNNAAAEIAALDRLFDRITPGGIILFDDYAWSASRAQYVAEKAWFAERGLVVLPLPTGQGLFVKPPA